VSQEATLDERYYANKMGRILLLAVEETAGRSGVNAILNLAGLSQLIDNYPPNNSDRRFNFRQVAAVQQALDSMYGPRGGRSLSHRAGRAAFRHGLVEIGPRSILANPAYRLLPLKMRIKLSFDALAHAFSQFSDQSVRLEEDDDCFSWLLESCALCWGRQSAEPCCHLAVGLVSGALSWASGGKHYPAEEEECAACGAPHCLIVVRKQPLE
jgi:hypothetical protein